MAMIGYVARVLTGVRFKKMNHMIDVVHQKCGQNNVRTFFDMLWCAVRYGAGYYDYTMFGFYNMTGAQRDTYLTRVRNKKVSNPGGHFCQDQPRLLRQRRGKAVCEGF